MKSVIKLVGVVLLQFLFFSVNAADFNPRDISHNKDYGYQIASELARIGGTSERIEVRYGDCAREDCSRDRQRFTMVAELPFKESDNWYSLSFYLPSNFMIQPAGTNLLGAGFIGSQKHSGRKSSYRGGKGTFWKVHSQANDYIHISAFEYEQGCNLIKISDAVGKWTDIMIRANYSDSAKNPIDVWINGRNVGCNLKRPLAAKGLSTNNLKYNKTGESKIYFSYGIYQAFVSRWLNKNKTKEVSGDVDLNWTTPSGNKLRSPDNTPFNEDWGIETPTAAIYYDAIRIGNSRDDVNIFYDDFELDMPVVKLEPFRVKYQAHKRLYYGSFAQFEKVENNTEYGYIISDDITGRAPTDEIEIFEIRPGDCIEYDCESDKERVQLMQQPKDNTLGDEHWYGWSMYYPKDYISIYPSRTVHSSFQQNNDTNWMFGNKKDDYLLIAKPDGSNNGDKIKYKLINGENLRGKWHKVEVHSKWSNDDSGFFKVWVNGVQKVDYNGRTMTEEFNHFRYGIARYNLSRYKDENDVENVPSQKIYFSNVKRADTREGLNP